jgi:hypothetical protein
MPDPLLYVAAIGAAALTAALVMAVIAWPRHANQDQDANSTRARVATVIGMAGGLIAGYWMLDLYVSWPPVNALDRLLTIILPAVVGIEFVAAFERVPRWLAWTLRMVLVTATGRVLLHGSVYLTSAHAPREIVTQLVTCAALTAGLWGLLAVLAARSPRAISIPVAVALTMICAGGLIMFAGYVSGGAATLPLSAALMATVASGCALARRPNVQAPIGISVIGLSGLVFIGRYFGGLSSAAALGLLLAPLVCWIPELLRRNRRADISKPGE